jgi:hypothetical protein
MANQSNSEQRATPATPGTSISGLAAALLIVFFFTPWFSACNAQVSGADLAGGIGEESALWLFGVPIVGLAVVGIAIRNLNQPLADVARRARYILALSVYPLLCIALLYVRLRASSNDALFDVRPLIQFEFGFYGTVLATVGMIAGAILDWAAGQGYAPKPHRAVTSLPRPVSSAISRPPPRAELPRPRAWLQGQAGGFAQQALELTQDAIRIGSGAGCEICLREPNAAEVHAVVKYARGQYYLQDQGSSIGTLLNGQRVEASVLKDEDLITIGRTLLCFRQR